MARFNIRASVASVDLRHASEVVVRVRPAGTPIDALPIRVNFRSGDSVDQATLEHAKSLSPGDWVDIDYTEDTNHPAVINLGRAIHPVS